MIMININAQILGSLDLVLTFEATAEHTRKKSFVQFCAILILQCEF